MRYIDYTGCKSTRERGKDLEITKLGKLTRTATKIAEENRLGVLKTRQGYFRIIRACGLGGYEDVLANLAEVDEYLKNLDKHKKARMF